jgi:transposase InsO family protein
LSNLLDTSFCVAAVEEALGKGRPEIFNTDQGSQFTDDDFTGVLRDHRIAISMDGRGRFSDNFVVRARIGRVQVPPRGGRRTGRSNHRRLAKRKAAT